MQRIQFGITGAVCAVAAVTALLWVSAPSTAWARHDCRKAQKAYERYQKELCEDPCDKDVERAWRKYQKHLAKCRCCCPTQMVSSCPTDGCPISSCPPQGCPPRVIQTSGCEPCCPSGFESGVEHAYGPSEPQPIPQDAPPPPPEIEPEELK